MNDSELSGEPTGKTNAPASDSVWKSPTTGFCLLGMESQTSHLRLTKVDLCQLEIDMLINSLLSICDWRLRGEYFMACSFRANVGIEGLAPYCNDPRSGNILLKLF